MLSKFHKTTSELSRRTLGTQKEVGQNIKDKKRDKRVRDGNLARGGSREGEMSKPQETRSPVGLWEVLESQRAT